MPFILVRKLIALYNYHLKHFSLNVFSALIFRVFGSVPCQVLGFFHIWLSFILWSDLNQVPEGGASLLIKWNSKKIMLSELKQALKSTNRVKKWLPTCHPKPLWVIGAPENYNDVIISGTWLPGSAQRQASWVGDNAYYFCLRPLAKDLGITWVVVVVLFHLSHFLLKRNWGKNNYP